MSSTVNKLNKAYTKRFKQLNKTILLDNNSGLNIFVEHLKYLRDFSIINKKPVELIASFNVAIEEFEAYKKDQQEFHWNNFCEFVKLNIKEWLTANDSV